MTDQAAITARFAVLALWCLRTEQPSRQQLAELEQAAQAFEATLDLSDDWAEHLADVAPEALPS